MLVNVLVLTGLSIGVVQIPADQVTSILLPALGLQLLFGNFFYFYLARKLARRTGRTDVTAMPYGPSVPPMFIVTFVIMLPIFLATKDPIKAWSAGIAWAFIIGLIILAGAFFGPWVRKVTPRAAMLGMLAGIALTFISMRPAAIMWEAAWIAIPVLVIIIVGFFANVRLPGNMPIGLAALLVGTAIGWIGGFMEGGNVSQAAKDIAIGLPGLEFDKLLDGMKELSPLLATAIPLGIFNVSEVMSNVESASAAGDDYNLRTVLLADGTGAVAGSMMGCPFPPAVYIGQPGWKKAGGRISYSLVTGIMIFALCILGMFPLLAALLPLPAIVPVLLFIGLVIGTQAFSAVPRAHYPAILLAVVPNIAAWGAGLVDNALVAAGTSVAEGRRGRPQRRGRHHRGPAHARPGGGPRGPRARRVRRVPHRPALRARRDHLRRGRAADARRAHARREGDVVRFPAQGGARLRVRRDRLPRLRGDEAARARARPDGPQRRARRRVRRGHDAAGPGSGGAAGAHEEGRGPGMTEAPTRRARRRSRSSTASASARRRSRGWRASCGGPGGRVVLVVERRGYGTRAACRRPTASRTTSTTSSRRSTRRGSSGRSWRAAAAARRSRSPRR